MYRLRELAEKDIETINKWRNDKRLIDLLGAPYRYIDINTDSEWFQNYLKNRKTTVRCSIVDEDDKLLGLISLTDVDQLNQCAVLHIMLGSEASFGKGIGTFAIKEMLNHAFNNLNLRRIELSVLESNSRAIHVYEKIGFVQEGIKRECVFKNGSFISMRMYAMLKNEFTAGITI
ncbi:GNAT family N-acetyltransferase [Treponema brennaborense]|uniref:GCN5-related N-acetyltransferase n=1 Tax=Treponema brennaborense (strain DSM 12168 / CIP 105900 / DD5/3) TaxID=906968 RepID=F4LID7_TREBD|nr:GNAT family protein [Treponema brennaborense]AEE16178.1 GCN5-related N-acetyltransferase [Treponema brennaborense DSM 12168]